MPGNWRPISLQTAIYKIFAAAMAKRLASWALAGKKFSICQNGFLPMEECAEHCFFMENLLCDTKRRKKDLRIMWLDLKNAFGTVSHELLRLMMQRLGVPTPFIDICQEISAGSSTDPLCGRIHPRPPTQSRNKTRLPPESTPLQHRPGGTSSSPRQSWLGLLICQWFHHQATGLCG